MSDEEAELVVARYADHLEGLRSRLPPAMRERLDSVALHDAQVRERTLDHHRQRLQLCLVAGDNQSGYYTVDLKYEGVALDRLDLQSLRSVAGDTKSQLLYDEIDVEDGYFVHRLLFWPYQSVDIYFRTIQLHKAPTPARLPFERAVRYLDLGAPDL